MVRRLLFLFSLPGWLVLLGGLVLHARVRDSAQPLAALFYALPLPLLAGVALILACLANKRAYGRLIAVLLFGITTVWWLANSFCWHSTPAAAAEKDILRILFWNLDRPKTPHEEMIRRVREFQPDIAGFVEPGPFVETQLAAYEAALPGYKAAWMPRGILWLSKGPSRYIQRGKLNSLGAYAEFEFQWNNRTLHAVVADVYADPFTPRGPELREALGFTENRSDAILMGDFNTPLESVHYAPYRVTLNEAFEAGGRGFRETWFWGLPLLSLDHIWLGKRWEVLETRKIQSLASDHAGILTTVRLK